MKCFGSHRQCLFNFMVVFFLAGCLLAAEVPSQADIDERIAPERDRSPIDLALSPDNRHLVTANHTSGSVSLIDVGTNVVLDELPTGRGAAAIAFTPDGQRVLVTAADDGKLEVLAIRAGRLIRVSSISLGGDPRGIAVSGDSCLAYVALAAADCVAVVDLAKAAVLTDIAVGRGPRTLALSPAGDRLAVGTRGDGSISVVDTREQRMLYQSKFVGLNIGQLACTADGRYAYFPWMSYGDRPIRKGNIREGWVMASRIARVRLDGPARREALALDERGRGMADPHGMALTPDGEWIVCSASGTGELVACRLTGLKLPIDGPGDHMDPQLAKDSSRMFRLPLEGRPMGLRLSTDGRRAYVANYLTDAVQVVDMVERRISGSIALSASHSPSLERRGEAIFFDAKRSFEGWYSCHSCHFEGGGNLVTMDTMNDGSADSYKTVLSLRGSAETGPWFWHGWQKDFGGAVRKSLGDTMLGPTATDDDVEALAAYLRTLAPRRHAARQSDAQMHAAAERGRRVFQSESAGCAECHTGKHFTDGKIHDLGLGSERDVYQGFNTPPLVGVGERARFLHDGRAKSLDDLLTKAHSPEKVSGTRPLKPDELRDLVVYLKSL